MATKIQRIKDLIADNKIETAFGEILALLENSPSYNDAVVRRSSYKRLKDSYNKGIISWDTINVESNKICHSILALIESNKSEATINDKLGAELDNFNNKLKYKVSSKKYVFLALSLFILLSISFSYMVLTNESEISTTIVLNECDRDYYNMWIIYNRELDDVYNSFKTYINYPTNDLKSDIKNNIKKLSNEYRTITKGIHEDCFNRQGLPVYGNDMQIIYNIMALFSIDDRKQKEFAEEAKENGKWIIEYVDEIYKQYNTTSNPDLFEYISWMNEKEIREDILLELAISNSILYNANNGDNTERLRLKNEIQYWVNQIPQEYITKYSIYKDFPILDSLVQQNIITSNY